MNQDLIIEALKSACGDRDFRFQVIIENSQLYIYVNYQLDSSLDYVWLTDTIKDAIANLIADSTKGIWLYSRKLGETEPDWQTFIELEVDSKNVSQEIFPVADSTGDTGLLLDVGMIHGTPLKEEEINTFVNDIDDADGSVVEVDNLVRYCFVGNKKILTGDIIPPDQKIIRLVKFFHHLSDSDKQKILPVLEVYFNQATVPDTEIPVAVKKWFKKITELNQTDRSVAAIWLSRYCFDRSTTLEEFEAIAQKKAVKPVQVKRSNTEYSFTPANTPTPEPEQIDNLTQSKFQLPPLVKKTIIPVVWTLGTIVLILLGVYSNHGNLNVKESLCETTIGSANYCRLGVALAGEDAIEQTFEDIFPMTIITESLADYGCQRYANLKAEAFNSLDPQQNPVTYSYGEKIFPNVYIAEAVQKKATAAENVRVACIYTTGAGERSPKLLATDVIPDNWSEVDYQPGGSDSNLAFGMYTNPINLGLNTIFCALGIAIASQLNLGISVTNRPQTIYLVALILGIVQLITFNLPVFNLLAGIILPIITICAIALLIKSFKIDWNYGYPLVATAILVIIGVQFLLYGISLKLIDSFL